MLKGQPKQAPCSYIHTHTHSATYGNNFSIFLSVSKHVHSIDLLIQNLRPTVLAETEINIKSVNALACFQTGITVFKIESSGPNNRSASHANKQQA
jgi:hypothetical protein